MVLWSTPIPEHFVFQLSGDVIRFCVDVREPECVSEDIVFWVRDEREHPEDNVLHQATFDFISGIFLVSYCISMTQFKVTKFVY